MATPPDIFERTAARVTRSIVVIGVAGSVGGLQGEEQIEHHPDRYMAFFGTLFVFILFSNLIGVIPGFESPTKFPAGAPRVRGRGLFLFLQHHRHQGTRTYQLRQALRRAGLVACATDVSHQENHQPLSARPLSLTVRSSSPICMPASRSLMVFLGLTYFAIPAVFMGLHVFVSVIQAYVFMVLTYVVCRLRHGTRALILPAFGPEQALCRLFQCEPVSLPTLAWNHLPESDLSRRKVP